LAGEIEVLGDMVHTIGLVGEIALFDKIVKSPSFRNVKIILMLPPDILWRDAISLPIARVSSVADGDDTGRLGQKGSIFCSLV
jgi:hypothetical protein